MLKDSFEVHDLPHLKENNQIGLKMIMKVRKIRINGIKMLDV
jgi:hypothetical protein